MAKENVVYIPNEYYSPLTKKEIMFQTIWMKLMVWDFFPVLNLISLCFFGYGNFFCFYNPDSFENSWPNDLYSVP